MYTKKNVRGLELDQYKKSLKLNDEQREVLIGTLLGDASMSLRKGKPHYSVKFEQKAERQVYINHLYDIFEPYVGAPPAPRFIQNNNSISGENFENKIIKSYWFRTYEHKSLIFYYNFFYKIKDGKKVKVVPKTIHKFLTARALAYWFMDDGTFNWNGNTKSYLFSTQGFQKFECQRLCEALKVNFQISASVHKDKDNWRIYILAKSSNLFMDLIRPYVHSNFYSKL